MKKEMIFLTYFFLLFQYTVAQQNIIRSIFACICDLSSDDVLSINCIRPSQIYVTNAYVYDDVSHDASINCTQGDEHSNPIFISDDLRSVCNNLGNCNFTRGYVHDSVSKYISDFTCAKVQIEWICLVKNNNNNMLTSVSDSSNNNDDADSNPYDFRYYLYVLIGVFLALAVVISTVILVRRLVLLKRQARARATTSNTNMRRHNTQNNGSNSFYIIYQHNGDNVNITNSEDINNSTTSSTLSPPPPLYETTITNTSEQQPTTTTTLQS